MSQQKRLRVRGKQRATIDPQLLIQVLLAIGDQDELVNQPGAITDVGEAAIALMDPES